MPWHPDVPDEYPYPKTRNLENLEKLSPDFRDSMTIPEMEEKIYEAADSIAKAYQKRAMQGNFEECVLMTSSALAQTGGSMEGRFGSKMVGLSQEAAKRACRDYYPEDTEPNHLEY